MSQVFHSLVQILKLNDVREGKTGAGRDYKLQDCEAVILNDDGSVHEVGVLMLPKDLVGVAKVGTYTAAFSLRADKSKEGGRRIGAVLTSLTAVPPATGARAPVAASVAAPK